jgi:signal transduction histidine kinase
MPLLKVREIGGVAREIRLRDVPVTIGRARDAGIPVADPRVSMNHALIEPAGGGTWRVIDLGSRNGTYVNGGRVQSIELKRGDVIDAGRVSIIFGDEEEETPRPAQTPDSSVSWTMSYDTLVSRIHESPSSIKRGLNDPGTRVREVLSTLYRLGTSPDATAGTGPAAEAAVRAAVQATSADRAVLCLAGPGDEPLPAASLGRDGKPVKNGLGASRTVIERAIAERAAVLTLDARVDQRFADTASIVAGGIRSAIAVPLVVAGGRCLGAIYVDRTRAGAFDEEDLHAIGVVAGQTAAILDNLDLISRLRVANEDLAAARERVLAANRDLEQRVLERTADLEARTREVERQNDEIRRLSEDKDRLLGMVAHDLRSPLTSILGGSQILDLEADGLKPDDVRHYASAITEAAKRMNELIGELLDSEAIARGKLRMTPQPVPVGAVVGDAVGALEGWAKCKEIPIEVDIPADLPALHVDARRAVQALTNLLSNAIKYSSSGTPVRVEARLAPDGAGMVDIAVRDRGPGIQAETLARLFQPFERGPARATGGEPSTGLGLFLVRRLVELMGGKVRTESAPGRGSTFALVLPVHAPARALEPLPARASAA